MLVKIDSGVFKGVTYSFTVDDLSDTWWVTMFKYKSYRNHQHQFVSSSLCDIRERVASHITISWQHVQFDSFRWINVGSRLQHDVDCMGTGMEVELGHGGDIASNK